MINKKESRLRRARATRARIKLQKVNRLTVYRLSVLTGYLANVRDWYA